MAFYGISAALWQCWFRDKMGVVGKLDRYQVFWHVETCPDLRKARITSLLKKKCIFSLVFSLVICILMVHKMSTAAVLVVQMERLRSFDFDAWRMQYFQWMKNNRSRVMDFFHRQDTDGDGKVTRKEFIEGIIKSRTSSSLLVTWNALMCFDALMANTVMVHLQ